MSVKAINATKRPTDVNERLQWVLDIIRREAEAGTYGVVSVHLEAGKITRVKTEKSELPEN